MIKFRHLEYFNTSWSLIIVFITIVQWLADAPWIYMLQSFIALLLLWSLWISYVMWKRPWHPQFRSEILKPFGHKYPFTTFYKTVFKKPMYESQYIVPVIEEQDVTGNLLDAQYVKSKISVIIEDDPVGYMWNRGSIPAFIVDEHTNRDTLLHTLQACKGRIEEESIFFIATPSRRLDENGSFLMNREIGYALRKFRNEFDRGFRIISKIDSCLRSNYEPEYRGLTDGFGVFSLEILAPSYIEQGRVTVHGSQYVKEENNITPIHESEFAGFRGLEFKNSNLALWMEARCAHISSRKNVGLLCIDKLRSQQPEELAEQLRGRPKNLQAVVFDSCEAEDLTLAFRILFCLEETSNEKILYKLGPSMINRLVVELKGDCEENHVSGILPGDSAIVVAGSLSSITKRQIANLRDEEKTSLVILSNRDIESQATHIVIDKKRRKILEYNSRGDNVVLTTEFWKESSNEYPDIQKRDKVLNLLAEICRLTGEQVQKKWIVLKGSDTALHVLNHGFGLKEFNYCGQVIPGVIHIKVLLADGCSYKSCFIIGGNVGEEDLLVKLVAEINQN